MYAKIFTSMYQGTLRGDAHGILVFTNLLAHADRCGQVDIHPRAIADEVGLSEEYVRAALLKLEAPDPESRTPIEDGRRIIRMDEHRIWGWQVVNYEKYRAIRNEDDRREQNRLAQERWRNKQSKQNKPASATISHKRDESAHADADADAKALKTERERSPTGSRLPADWTCPQEWLAYCRERRPELDPQAVACNFADYWHAKAGAGARKADWLATWRSWVRKEAAQPGTRSSPSAAHVTDNPQIAETRARLDAEARRNLAVDPERIAAARRLITESKMRLVDPPAPE